MIRRLPMIVLFALAAGGAAAQTIYKSVMPDGKITYGNAPVKGAATVESIQPTLPPPTEGGTAPNARETAEARTAERAPSTLDDKWKVVEQEIRDAQAALAAAKANAEAGVAPIAGEMVGNAGNPFVRPSEAYSARQKQLADRVREAQARVDEAFAARNALR